MSNREEMGDASSELYETKVFTSLEIKKSRDNCERNQGDKMAG